MEKKLRILYVTSEIEPFLKLTSAADIIRPLPQKFQEKGHDIRIFMPKFGVINERRNRLHEVVRLSGINIRVAGEEKPLTIKVASIPNAKLQVYFLDNEDYFKRKSAITDPTDNSFHADNDERAIFFCKGVIETVKKLGWAPDIIHCHDWMTSFLPVYMRTHYQNDPMFRNTKIIYTLYNNGIEDSFTGNFLEKMRVDGINDETLNNYDSNDYVSMCKGGISLADATTVGHTNFLPESLGKYLEQSEKAHFFDSTDQDQYVESFNKLYTTITA
ncbi:MAG: glycogen/starch synthase [Bacteroidia bacterium]